MEFNPKVPPLFRRIAVTPEQIREHSFITAPPKKSDKRGSWDGNTVQCEAIPSPLLAEIVREAILEHYDEGAINDLHDVAKDLRPSLSALFGDVDVSALSREFHRNIHTITSGASDHDWTGGYDNSDEDHMEEGI